MREELIINGEVVDTGNVNISLEYVNNMLTQVDKISSSHSYTISLPRTANNERIFNAPTMVAHKSNKVGVYLPAEYRRNGITIVRNGKAYVTSAKGNTIDICLIWDNLAPFAEWVSSGKTIADLGYVNPSWATTGSLWSARTNEVLLAYADSGVDTDTIVCLNFYRMVRKIMDGIGVSWYISNGSSAALASNLAVPCLKFVGAWDAESGQYSVNTRNGDFCLYYEEGKQYPITGDTRISVGKRKTMTFDCDGLTLYGSFASSASVRLVGWKGGSTAPVTLKTHALTLSSSRTSATLTMHDEVDVSEYQNYYVYFVIDGLTEGSLNSDGRTISLRSYYDKPTHNTEYHIETCAPSVKQVDVIKAFCTMFGLAVITTPEGTLKFVPLSNLKQRNSWNIYDWTDKVVNYGDDMPNKIEYKVGSYARKNIYAYTEDTKDPVTGADGELYSSSVTIGTTYDAVKLPFAATDGETIRYKEVDDSGNTKYVDLKPRIVAMNAYSVSGISRIKLKFKPEQRFDNILSNYYGVINDLLQYPLTITTYVRLNEYELGNLEMDKVVYLGQTGRYYIISKVKTDNKSDICEVELIQM